MVTIEKGERVKNRSAAEILLSYFSSSKFSSIIFVLSEILAPLMLKGWLNFLRLPLKDDPCPSLAWQGFNKLTHQIDGGFFVLPGLTIMLAEKRIRGCDDNHIKLIQ